jgi:hypothetical protein
MGRGSVRRLPRARDGLPVGGSQRTLLVGLGEVTGVAVDGAGDVFAADYEGDRVVELPVGGSQRTLPFSGLIEPQGVAVGGAGDVYVTDAIGDVFELPVGGPQEGLPFSGLSGSVFGFGVAVRRGTCTSPTLSTIGRSSLRRLCRRARA